MLGLGIGAWGLGSGVWVWTLARGEGEKRPKLEPKMVASIAPADEAHVRFQALETHLLFALANLLVFARKRTRLCSLIIIYCSAVRGAILNVRGFQVCNFERFRVSGWEAPVVGELGMLIEEIVGPTPYIIHPTPYIVHPTSRSEGLEEPVVGELGMLIEDTVGLSNEKRCCPLPPWDHGLG